MLENNLPPPEQKTGEEIFAEIEALWEKLCEPMTPAQWREWQRINEINSIL